MTSKAGPLPVWGWGAIGLGAAYAWSRHQAAKSAQTQPATSAGAAEPTSSNPYYVIENNVPGYAGASTPVTTPSGPPPPAVTPPGTSPQPPTAGPPPGGPVNLPPGAGQPVHAPGTAPGEAAAPPATSGSHPAPAPVGGKAPSRSPITYRVMTGDTYSKIASVYRVPGGAQALYTYNTNPTYNSAAATFRAQGPNLLHAGQTIHVPQ